MIFDRYYLVSAIKEAKDECITIYNELNKIFYKLLIQESINKDFINLFYYYDNISNLAIEFYLNQTKKADIE